MSDTHLADTGVADKEELEEIIVFAGVHGGRWGRGGGGRAEEELKEALRQQPKAVPNAWHVARPRSIVPMVPAPPPPSLIWFLFAMEQSFAARFQSCSYMTEMCSCDVLGT